MYTLCSSQTQPANTQELRGVLAIVQTLPSVGSLASLRQAQFYMPWFCCDYILLPPRPRELEPEDDAAAAAGAGSGNNNKNKNNDNDNNNNSEGDGAGPGEAVVVEEDEETVERRNADRESQRAFKAEVAAAASTESALAAESAVKLKRDEHNRLRHQIEACVCACVSVCMHVCVPCRGRWVRR
jgi:hypothetical protein